MSEEKISRRKYLKYAVAGGVVGALGAGGLVHYYHTGIEREAEESINLAIFHPVSGPGAPVGQPWYQADLLAANHINKKGINGFSKMNIYFNDTETSNAAVTRKWQRITATEQIDAVIYGGLESVNATVIKLAVEGGYPVLKGGEYGLFKFFDMPFSKYRLVQCMSCMEQGLLAGRLMEESDVKKVAYLGGDFEYGYELLAGLAAYNSMHGNPFEIDPILHVPIDKTDFTSEITLIKDANVGGLFGVYPGAGFLSLPKQLVNANAKPEMVFWSADYTSLGIAELCGYEGMKNSYCLSSARDPRSDDFKEFVEVWRNEYGIDSYPFLESEAYYQIIWALKAAFEEAGTKDKEAVIETMRKNKWCGEEGALQPALSCTGPFDEYGQNLSWKGLVIQFQEGASELIPDFNLHSEVVGDHEIKYSSPELLDLLNEYRPK